MTTPSGQLDSRTRKLIEGAAVGFETLCRNIAGLEIDPAQLAEQIGAHVDRGIVGAAMQFLSDYLDGDHLRRSRCRRLTRGEL